ncbi:hypothetical protein C2845_PM06G09620 [Panicum miliaceum]|uniref:Uncharacterized protein n=1 Tax=Panicum miliaceum TaxID=4540 RepID=A0A3L6RAD7_PANMI|nr:hypothetical protein C2845_PM06G09620 [Panicum miliaceum]
MNFNRRQREAVRLHVIAGPGAGTAEAIRASDFRSGGYVRGAMARLFDVDDGIDQDALVATLYDDDEYDDLLAQAGLRRSSKRARTSEATLQGLPEVTAGRSREGEDCAVCLQGFRADETLRAMPAPTPSTNTASPSGSAATPSARSVATSCRPPRRRTPTPTPTSRLLAS